MRKLLAFSLLALAFLSACSTKGNDRAAAGNAQYPVITVYKPPT